MRLEISERSDTTEGETKEKVRRKGEKNTEDVSKKTCKVSTEYWVAKMKTVQTIAEKANMTARKAGQSRQKMAGVCV